VSGSRPRTGNAQRDPTPNQQDADEGRNPLTVAGLNAEIRTSDLNAVGLGLRDRDHQGGDAKHYQEQSGKKQDLHLVLAIVINLNGKLRRKNS